MNEAILKLITDAAGADNMILGDMIGADYCHDEFPGGNYTPDAVVDAVSTEQVAAVLKVCYENDVPVTVRGAGTGQVGGSVAIKGGIVLSVKNLNQVLEYNEAESTIRASAGVLLQQVKALAEENGKYYPPDPGEATATVGGNVATNAAGPCAVKYGKTGNYVVDAVLVLADGIVTTLAGKEDVVGSEGTLAVITEVTLKVLDKVGEDAILLFPMMDIESGVAAAKAIAAAGFEPAVAELMDTDIVEFSGNVTGNPVFPVVMDGERVGCTLMVTVEGADDDDVMEKMEAIAGLAEEGEIEPLDILVGDSITMKREFWAAHAAFHTSMESGAKSAFEVNVDVPTDAMAEMIEYSKEVCEANGLKAYIHAHVLSGGMHIHVASDKSREETAETAKVVRDTLHAKVKELGGNIGGEYGIGYAKIEYMCDACKADFAAKKAALDPKGILNPGKLG